MCLNLVNGPGKDLKVTIQALNLRISTWDSDRFFFYVLHSKILNFCLGTPGILF